MENGPLISDFPIKTFNFIRIFHCHLDYRRVHSLTDSYAVGWWYTCAFAPCRRHHVGGEAENFPAVQEGGVGVVPDLVPVVPTKAPQGGIFTVPSRCQWRQGADIGAGNFQSTPLVLIGWNWFQLVEKYWSYQIRSYHETVPNGHPPVWEPGFPYLVCFLVFVAFPIFALRPGQRGNAATLRQGVCRCRGTLARTGARRFQEFCEPENDLFPEWIDMDTSNHLQYRKWTIALATGMLAYWRLFFLFIPFLWLWKCWRLIWMQSMMSPAEASSNAVKNGSVDFLCSTGTPWRNMKNCQVQTIVFFVTHANE